MARLPSTLRKSKLTAPDLDWHEGHVAAPSDYREHLFGIPSSENDQGSM
jgi:hypothetical protein